MTQTAINWTATGDSWTAELEGFALSLTMEHDSDHGAPWEEEDGHGPVTAWTTRDKLPGELIIAEDRNSKRFYDFAEACRTARAEGWDAKPYNKGGETPRQQAAKAARADFRHLKAWADDQWRYNVLCVTASREGIELGTAYLGGVAYEDDDASEAYALECAEDMAGEAIAEAQAMLEKLAA